MLTSAGRVFYDASAFFLTSPLPLPPPPRMRVSGRSRERGRFRRPRPLRRVLGTLVYFIIRTQITYIRNVYTRCIRYITTINNKTYFVIYFIFFFFFFSPCPRGMKPIRIIHSYEYAFLKSDRARDTHARQSQTNKSKKKKKTTATAFIVLFTVTTSTGLLPVQTAASVIERAKIHMYV